MILIIRNLNLISVQTWTNLISPGLTSSNNNRSSCFSRDHLFPTSFPWSPPRPPSPYPPPPPPSPLRAEQVMGTRLFCFSNLFCFTLLLRKSAVCLDTVLYGRIHFMSRAASFDCGLANRSCISRSVKCDMLSYFSHLSPGLNASIV